MTLRNLTTPSPTVDALRASTIAVLGYGSQGAAHAQNLRDSGLNVVVGQRSGSVRHSDAERDGFRPVSIAEAVRAGDLLIFGLPDDRAGQIYREQIAPLVRPGQTLGFIHGFAIHYEQIRPLANNDVVLVAPKAQGRGVRNLFVAGRGPVALVAVHQDATGGALNTALAWAAGIGAGRAGILETTFRDETETDLFGEQAVLCGGLSSLIFAAFDTLLEAGYPPELAYFECCHEVKLLADLIHDGGIAHMRARISSTARYGDLTRGGRVVDERVRGAMRELLAEIRDGRFAAEFLADAAAGGARMSELMRSAAHHAIETVGTELRGMARAASSEQFNQPKPPHAE